VRNFFADNVAQLGKYVHTYLLDKHMNQCNLIIYPNGLFQLKIITEFYEVFKFGWLL